jgi:hypothetical protein
MHGGGPVLGLVGLRPTLDSMLPRIALRRSFSRRDPRTWRRTAKRLGSPLFALKGGGQPRQGGFGWGSDSTYKASLVQSGPHGEVTVETASGPHPYHDDWLLLRMWLHRAVEPDGETSFPVELRADRWVASVVYAGSPYEFTVVGDDGCWAAGGVVAGRSVLLEGRGPTDGLELEAVSRRAVAADA